MVGHLRHIDEDLAERVAAGLALKPLPEAPPAAAPVVDLDPSPALQLIGKMKDTLEGRQVAILVADGSDGDAVEALKAAATEAGATVKIVAPKVGGATLADGTLLEADGQLAGTPSVFFDAVAVVLSAEGAALLTGESAAQGLRRRRVRPPQGHRRGRRRRDAADRRRDREGRRRGPRDGRRGLHRRGEDASVGARAQGAHPGVSQGSHPGVNERRRVALAAARLRSCGPRGTSQLGISARLLTLAARRASPSPRRPYSTSVSPTARPAPSGGATR